MKTHTTLVLVVALALFAGHGGCGCMGGKQIQRPYPEPSPQMLLDHLATVRQNARSFQVESVMDYWVGKERVKGSVLLMGQVGARMRINALNPTGDNVAADLACDGVNFQLIDYNSNCQLTGPCNRASVAQLLRVSLEPDDFLLLVMGTTPVIAASKTELSWDAKNGYEVLTLTSADGRLRQTIKLDGRERRWDVVSSVVRDAGGQVLWNLQNKDFRELESVDGIEFRAPARTRLEQPREKADLIVRWVERTFNPALDPQKFQMSIPPGLPHCK
jgi:hypothetical protein